MTPLPPQFSKTLPRIVKLIGAAKNASTEPYPTTPYPWSGKKNDDLQKLLTKAINATKGKTPDFVKQRIPFSMIAIEASGNHLYAGFLDGVNGGDMDYAASLLKVAVMYAAFELRAAANRLVAELTTTFSDLTPTDVFSALHLAFDHKIAAVAVRRLRGMPQEDPKTPVDLPRYEKIFTFSKTQKPPLGPIDFSSTPVNCDRTERKMVDGKWQILPVHSSRSFSEALDKMIIESNDMGASQCISALGYSYINAVLTKGGFFTPHSMSGDERGIWVGGDYMSLAQSRIRAVNDGTGAYVMNTEAMCRLVALIHTEVAVDDTKVGGISNSEMKGDLLAAVQALKPYVLHRSSLAPGLSFSVMGNKLGVAGLGVNETGVFVASECSVLRWNKDPAVDPDGAIAKGLAKHNLTGDLVICWQNWAIHDWSASWDTIGDIVGQTYGEFLKT